MELPVQSMQSIIRKPDFCSENFRSTADLPVDTSSRRKPARVGRHAGDAIQVIVASACVVAGLYVFARTVEMVIHGWSSAPYWDQWNELILSPRQLISSWLYSQHNEHRILFPRLLFAIDTFAFAGTNKFNFFCNLAFPFGLAGLIVLFTDRYVSRNRTDTLWIAGISLTLLFSAMQWENLLWGFQVGFSGVELAAVGSIGCLVLGRHRWRSLIGSIVFSTIAVYTLASGMPVPFLALPLAIWARRSRLEVAVLAVAAIVLLACYLHGYTSPPGHSNPLVTIFRPDIAHYAAAELGNPWGRFFREFLNFDSVAWDTGAGVVGFVLFGVALISCLLHGRSIDKGRLVFLGIAAYPLTVTLLTALGRLEFGFEQALASRYAAPMLLFWLSLIVLGIIQIRDRPRLRLFAMALSLILVGGLALAQPYFVKTGSAWALPHRDAATALLANVDDEVALARTHPIPAQVKEWSAELRAQHLAMFADPWSTWLATPLTDHVRLGAPGECRGSIEDIERLPVSVRPEWRVSGWAWDNARRAPVERVVIADKAGRVVGYALGGYPASLRSGGPKHSGWRGHFASEDAPAATAYALLDGERIGCPLARLSEVR